MPDLLTLSERADYASAMQDLHDTFARNIVIYQTATKTVVSTSPNHNFLYGSGPAQTVTEDVIVSGTYKARIHYPKESALEQFLRAGGAKNDDQIQLKRKDWKVKLVVDITVKPILEKCERIEFDGTLFSVESDPRPHGVVGPQFWDYYLSALN
jgi:hypothetical protein